MSFQYAAISSSRTIRQLGVNLNAGANTDAVTIAGFPARYILRRVTFDNASGSPTLATMDVRTATGGGGSALVAAQALSALTATTKFIDCTLAAIATTDVVTATSLTLRNVAAQGSAMTADCTIEFEPLP